MKLLVFSDSHHHLRQMTDIVAAELPDMILHLGDYLQDAQAIAARFPDIPLHAVPGNCDGWTNQLPVRTLELSGRRILMGHGHTWQVKRGYSAAVAAACAAGADILLFGHTHIAYCGLIGGLWVMNPGSIQGGVTSNYGVITLENKKTMCYTVTN